MKTIWIIFPSKTLLTWTGGTCAQWFNVYRANLQQPADADFDGLADDYGTCFLPNVFVTQAPDATIPAPDFMYTYLVTGENAVGEGGMGFTSALLERPNRAPCP